MTGNPGTTRMLASVTTLAEARMVIAAGADLVDLNDPTQGALGALSIDTIRAVVSDVGNECLTSATVGDLPMVPATVTAAAERIAKTGVDYVKVGVFPGDEPRRCVTDLGRLAAAGTRLVIVMFADCEPDLSLIPLIKKSGCTGVMLDTAAKRGGGLREVMSQADLREFVARAREAELMAGLAGSLRVEDIPVLLELAPDYLGFRGALCAGSTRTREIDAAAVSRVRAQIPLEPPAVLRNAS